MTHTPPRLDVNWPAFLGRLDPVWDRLPTDIDDGAFAGNGWLGATLYSDGPRRLRFEIGRCDVTEHRRDNNRLPVGCLVVTTTGEFTNGHLRIDLWNGEITGRVTTSTGILRLRCVVHALAPAVLLDLECEGRETPTVTWEQGHGQDKRNRDKIPDDPPNPPAVTATIRGLPVAIQPRLAGGEYATSWTETRHGNARRITLSVADSFPDHTARQLVVEQVMSAASPSFDPDLNEHRAWWHAFYPRSFVSIPDLKLESFYWIQMYKFASATRPDAGPVDLLGPWFRQTNWPRVWWNMNIECLYLPAFTANQPGLVESFIRFIDAKRDNFRANAKVLYGIENGAGVSHSTCREGLLGDGSWYQKRFLSPGDFVWALHLYWLHYRHGMDHALITDRTTHAFYELLRDAVNVFLYLMEEGNDGKLHLPVLHSPEYGDARDTNYNLALFRWACTTLIELAQRYGFEEPLVPRWQEVLDRLTPYATDANGFRIGADCAVENSHRHWSHLLMAHPLHTLDLDRAENRDTLRHSIAHWLSVGDSTGIYAWSQSGAASLYAALGDGNEALACLHRHLSDTRFVHPNTMYIEQYPVLECSIIVARSVQDMLLQSHGGTLRIFPAVPDAWPEAVFHDFRAEGGFRVSARREGGRTRWILIRSEAGEPCLLRQPFSGSFTSSVPCARQDDHHWALNLQRRRGGAADRRRGVRLHRD
jgi:alpha-L-fucosidase 2